MYYFSPREPDPLGSGSSYYNYSVYTSTSVHDANLGGYYSSGVTSAMTNMSYYVVSNAVTVVDSMATTKCRTTTIYRSVSEAEAMDIMNTGKFNLSPNGMECKQFGFDLLETKTFGDMMKQRIVVSAEIPNEMLNKMYTGGVDPNVFRSGTLTVYENQLYEFNLAVKGTIRIVP